MSEEKKSFQRDGQSPTAIELVQDAIDNGDLGVGDLRVTTPPQSNACAEAAMPGTASIPPLFTLVPPPVDRDLRFSADDGLRDYGPDPIAEYALAMPARAVFPVAPLSAAITPELRRYFSSPTFYVRTPSGQVTYMVSADGPKQATEIIAGWSLAAEGKYPVQNVILGAQGLARWLAARQEGIAAVDPAPAQIVAQYQVVRRIVEIMPKDVYIGILSKSQGDRFDGQKVWRTLHALGMHWGDLDQFRRCDPTRQTDYLFRAEVNDDELGYALPEEIAAGRQFFQSVRFGFNIPRTPHPAHVLQQMARAAECFAAQLDGRLVGMVDGKGGHGQEALEAAVRKVVKKLQACGVKPGSSSACRLC
jgi:ZipA, C-terminal FtsZ-binding domain